MFTMSIGIVSEQTTVMDNSVQDIYNNFRIDDERESPNWTVRRLRAIFQTRRFHSKINISYGFILRNLRDEGTVASTTIVFDIPSMISSMTDLEAFLQWLQNEDVLNNDNKWVVHLIIKNRKKGFPISFHGISKV